MVQYDRFVINELINSYEASLLSIGENKRTVHIEFSFVKKKIPAYFDESSSEYERIHEAMKDLEEKGFIRIIWKGNRIGHIISKVRLDPEKLDGAYAYVGRTPKNDLVSANWQMLRDYMENNLSEEHLRDTPVSVCRAFIKYLLERLEAHKSVKEFMELEDISSARKLLDTVRAIENNQAQLYLREFSMLQFQDSKAFEKLESKIAHVFRRFKEGCEEMDSDEILAEYGIYHTPNYVYIKGEAAISIGGERVDLSALKQGLGISGDDIESVLFQDTSRIKKVVTIENLTTFFRWQEADSLLVYLGGYHNTLRRRLLGEIYGSCPGAAYLHFGDIDVGGFEIYRDLKEKTGIPFEMYYMDVETLKAYEEYGRPLTENDRRRLSKMREWEECKEVVEYMLERGVKLEQEIVCLRNSWRVV